jgi:hypothetical protein
MRHTEARLSGACGGIEQWITRSKSAEMKRAGAAANAPVRNCRLTWRKATQIGIEVHLSDFPGFRIAQPVGRARAHSGRAAMPCATGGRDHYRVLTYLKAR